MDSATLANVDRQIIGDIWTSDAAWRNLVRLCDDFGSRFGGTPGESQAIEYLLAKMREYGLENVRGEEFAYNGWVRGTLTFETVSPIARVWEGISLPYTPTADVTGDLINLGYGTPAEFLAAGDNIRGKVALLSARSPAYFRRGIHRGEKYGRAVEAGAVAVLWMRDEGGHLPETGSLRFDKPAEVPGIGVSKETGSALLRLQERGPVTIHIKTTDENRRMTSQNVVGEIVGRRHPDQVIVTGAHFDGHDIAVGAADDGAGAVVTLEAARGLAQHKAAVARTLRFVLFPLEELGLIGAFNYVRAHQHELDQIKFMLNLDGAGTEAMSKGMALQGFPELMPYFKAIGRDMGDPFICDESLSMYSDHFPFTLQGVPTGFLQNMEERRGVRGWGHTSADTLDKVQPRHLRFGALMVARILLRMANRDDYPGRRRSPAEIAQMLETIGYAEVMRVEKNWPY